MLSSEQSQQKGSPNPMSSGLRPQDLNDMYESLSPEERDELLRILLYAASISGQTVIQRLEERIARPTGEGQTGDLPDQ